MRHRQTRLPTTSITDEPLKDPKRSVVIPVCLLVHECILKKGAWLVVQEGGPFHRFLSECVRLLHDPSFALKSMDLAPTVRESHLFCWQRTMI